MNKAAREEAKEQAGALVVAGVGGEIALDVERAKNILAVCKTTDEAKGIKDKAAAVAVYLRSKRAALTARNDAQEIAARAERRMGEILAEAHIPRGRRKEKLAKGETPAPKLADYGVTKAESKRAQKLADIPESEFAKRIALIRDRGDVITNKALVSLTADSAHDGDEWRTPPEFVEKARRVMGGIDLDPASSEEANKAIRAARCYTKADDGLAKTWAGRVWLNPPYSHPAATQFVERLVAAHEAGTVRAAVVLVNNATDTGWFQNLLGRYPCCLTRGRIGFLLPGGKRADGNRQGQAFFFLGCDPAAVAREFADVGTIVAKVRA